ncbi:hypothetical protein H4582DRAFT_1908952 [Lactarius indigo]|nr:hypothetical protein H4582DRAFT_1908952 [Lactarius indigo]
MMTCQIVIFCVGGAWRALPNPSLWALCGIFGKYMRRVGCPEPQAIVLPASSCAACSTNSDALNCLVSDGRTRV